MRLWNEHCFELILFFSCKMYHVNGTIRPISHPFRRRLQFVSALFPYSERTVALLVSFKTHSNRIWFTFFRHDTKLCLRSKRTLNYEQKCGSLLSGEGIWKILEIRRRSNLRSMGMEKCLHFQKSIKWKIKWQFWKCPQISEGIISNSSCQREEGDFPSSVLVTLPPWLWFRVSLPLLRNPVRSWFSAFWSQYFRSISTAARYSVNVLFPTNWVNSQYLRQPVQLLFIAIWKMNPAVKKRHIGIQITIGTHKNCYTKA